MKKLILNVVIFLFATSLCQSQVIITHSGILYDFDGNELLNGVFEGKTTILRESINGPVEKSRNEKIETDSNGEYEFEIWTVDGEHYVIDEYNELDYFIKFEVDRDNDGEFEVIYCSQILKDRCDQVIKWQKKKEESLITKISELESELIESNKIKEDITETNKPNKMPLSGIEGLKVLDNQIIVESIEGGYNPYNSDNLWIPNFSMKLKNISGKDISDYNKIQVTFMDMNSNEKLSSIYKYISTDDDVIFNGTTVNVSFKSDRGWITLPKDVNVIAKISFDGEKYHDFSIQRKEYRP